MKLSNFICTSIERYLFGPPDLSNSSSKKFKHEKVFSSDDNKTSSSINPTAVITCDYNRCRQSTTTSHQNTKFFIKQASHGPVPNTGPTPAVITHYISNEPPPHDSVNRGYRFEPLIDVDPNMPLTKPAPH
jgi:hypothetical protein